MTAKRRRPASNKWVAAIVLLAAVAGVYAVSRQESTPVGPPCRAAIGTSSVSFTQPQAQNATTIAAVASRMGMPNHAVTVAFATALQESNLYNLDYGDRDSVGLFQQRPSQGWGTAEQIMSPRYSATQFYVHLARLPDWNNMSVNDAAQAVQRSAFPDAYGQWEDQARAAARALTGEEPATFTCRADIDSAALLSSDVEEVLRSEAGTPTLDASVSEPRGWMLSSWLVAHAETYNIRTVAFNGQKWTASTGAWAPTAPASLQVSVS